MDQLTVGRIRKAIIGLPDESVVNVVTEHWTDEADPDGMMVEDTTPATTATPDHAKRTLTITV